MFRISLTAARINAELEQADAALKMEIPAETLSNYERGITAIPGLILRRAAKLYGISEEVIKLPIVNDGHYDDFLYINTV